MIKKIIIPIILFTLISCSKEEYLTEGEKIAIEMQHVANEKSITQAIINYSGSTVQSFKDFKIENQFIIVENHYYNLNELVFWKVFIIDNQNFYDIYF